MKKADNKDEKLNRNLSWKILDETTVIKDSWIDMRASTCQLPGGMVIAPLLCQSSAGFCGGGGGNARAQGDNGAPVPPRRGEGASGASGGMHRGRRGSKGRCCQRTAGGNRIQGRESGIPLQNRSECQQLHQLCPVLPGQECIPGRTPESG